MFAWVQLNQSIFRNRFAEPISILDCNIEKYLKKEFQWVLDTSNVKPINWHRHWNWYLSWLNSSCLKHRFVENRANFRANAEYRQQIWQVFSRDLALMYYRSYRNWNSKQFWLEILTIKTCQTEAYASHESLLDFLRTSGLLARYPIPWEILS